MKKLTSTLLLPILLSPGISQASMKADREAEEVSGTESATQESWGEATARKATRIYRWFRADPLWRIVIPGTVVLGGVGIVWYMNPGVFSFSTNGEVVTGGGDIVGDEVVTGGGDITGDEVVTGGVDVTGAIGNSNGVNKTALLNLIRFGNSQVGSMLHTGPGGNDVVGMFRQTTDLKVAEAYEAYLAGKGSHGMITDHNVFSGVLKKAIDSNGFTFWEQGYDSEVGIELAGFMKHFVGPGKNYETPIAIVNAIPNLFVDMNYYTTPDTCLDLKPAQQAAAFTLGNVLGL